jgi:hypothetical protein
MMQRYSSVNGSTPVGIITVEAGGNATAQNGGQIVAESGGVLTGAGTFTGPGRIQSGGAMMPAGRLTWTGNLTFESGSLLDVEIAGATAGTQHDVVNVSGALAMNGMLNIRFVNGFGNVQPARRSTSSRQAHPSPRHSMALAWRYSARMAPSKSNWSMEGTPFAWRTTKAPGRSPSAGWASSYGLSGRCGSDDR